MVLKWLADKGLLINDEKCQFGCSAVEYLGHLVSTKGGHNLPSKMNVIQENILSSTCRKLRHFIDLINFYRRFIAHSGAISAYIYTPTDVWFG